MRIGVNLCFLTLTIAIINTLPFSSIFSIFTKKYESFKNTRISAREMYKKIKRPAHLSIVERLGGYWCCKGTKIIRNLQTFGDVFYLLLNFTRFSTNPRCPNPLEIPLVHDQQEGKPTTNHVTSAPYHYWAKSNPRNT